MTNKEKYDKIADDFHKEDKIFRATLAPEELAKLEAVDAAREILIKAGVSHWIISENMTHRGFESYEARSYYPVIFDEDGSTSAAGFEFAKENRGGLAFTAFYQFQGILNQAGLDMEDITPEMVLSFFLKEASDYQEGFKAQDLNYK